MGSMDIVIIGTGNTATVLGRKLRGAGHRIVQVYGRDSQAASALAYELDTESTNYFNVVNREADLYLLAVSDSAIREVAGELRLQDRLLVHTAASVSREVLRGQAGRYGVFYPVQSLRRETGRAPEVPVIIDAGDPVTLRQLEVLAYSISDRVVTAGDEERRKLHLAAVVVNNFVNHLYALADTYCRSEGVDFQLLLPLIRETAARLQDLPPGQSQTGPAIRGDQQTVEAHLRLLDAHPQLRRIYGLMTESIRAGS